MQWETIARNHDTEEEQIHEELEYIGNCLKVQDYFTLPERFHSRADKFRKSSKAKVKGANKRRRHLSHVLCCLLSISWITNLAEVDSTLAKRIRNSKPKSIIMFGPFNEVTVAAR